MKSGAVRIDQGVILIGGRGTRLESLTQGLAKPMVEVGGRPFVEHVISHLARFGVRNVTLLAGHQGALPRERYHKRRLFGADVSVIVEPEPLGTGGALRFAGEQLDETFLLSNGDTFFDADLLPFIRLSQRPEWQAAMLLRRIDDPTRYGTVELDAQSAVRVFREKSADAAVTDRLVNAGTYLIRRDAILAKVHRTPCSLENELFPRLATTGALYGLEAEGYFIDIGIPESLEAARRDLVNRRHRPAAFLDRDGVLNVDKGYTHRTHQLEWIEGAVKTIRNLNEGGYYVFVVTNQSGIARGYYDETAVAKFHSQMQDELMAAGAHIDAFYYCPHHPEGAIKEFAIRCSCRKPGTGLLQQAANDWYIDIGRSFMIGDKGSDLAAATSFQIPGIMFDRRTDSLSDLATQAMIRSNQQRG